MGRIIKATAWSNGEVAYLAWEADAAIDDCLGFMVTREHLSGADQGQERILPTWIAFVDQSNPAWLNQDSSVWPIQQYQWRDLTLRQSRDTTSVRPIDFTVRYKITPVGLAGHGRPALPASPTAPPVDADGKPRYIGAPRPLAALAEPFVTEAVRVTHGYGDIQATYTNGILSTQNLLQQLQSLQGQPPGDVRPGPTTGVTPGLLATLQKHIPIEGDPIRTFLTGDTLALLLRLIERAEGGAGELYLALYELHDPQLIRRLTALAAAGKAHVILSTAGSTDPNPKRDPPTPRLPTVWDTENHYARAGLHAASAANVQDRLFNNSAHIGHNKFTIYVEAGVAKAVLTGSTNWTETGLCTQSNNAILIEDDAVAGLYLDYWIRLRADVQPVGSPISVPRGRTSIDGFAASGGVQGQALRSANAAPTGPVTLKDGKTTVEVLFSPNTKATTKTDASPTPVDLARVYSLMEHAEHAVLFLAFLPGVDGRQDIIGTAARLATDRPDLLVQGAISDPSALPAAVAGEPTTYTKPDGSTAKLPPRAIWWPNGDRSRVVMVRAAAITEPYGDLRPELLSAGHAIIHDKIVVIDPLDPDKCAVITGSHNLGYKASYQNDENLLIIRSNQALAISYAVHVLDVYDHYVLRAKLQEDLRQALIEAHVAPVGQTGGGFLKTTPDWQAKWFRPAAEPTARAYFLR